MSTKNLYSKEAKEKIKKMAESIDYTMMATNLNSQPFHVVPMSTKEVDEKENRTHLIYADKGNFEFLSIYGRAHISTDRNRIKELYGSGDDAWFDGEDDPNITAIKVVPEDAHYWDTKNGKVLSLLKMAQGAITGNEPDLGVQGDLKV